MTRETNELETRQRVMAALSPLIGLPLTAADRAADMRMFDFGTVRSTDAGSVCEFALHVQCAWRIEGPEGIVTGRSDLWDPVDEDAPFEEDWHYDDSPNLQDACVESWFEGHKATLIVEAVDADDFGGAALRFAGGFVLRLFPAGTRGEDWRLFRPKSDGPHFVISGGVVEDDDREMTNGRSA